MAAPQKPGAALLALTASALGLPGYAGNAEAWAEPQAQSAYRYSAYREAALPADKTNGLDGTRYSVDTHQFQLLWPHGDRQDFTADLTVETMSGASPWFIVPDANGKPIQIMSGATIQDTRADLELHTRLHQQDARQTLSAGVNHERDYLALNAGVESEWDFDERRRTLSAGLGYSHDELRPTDGGSARFPGRIASAGKNSATAYAGYSQVLGPQTVAQLGLSYTYDNGYLSDPYKQVYVAGSVLPDHRPQRRNQFALTARLRQYFPAVAAALHLDLRRYGDDWGIASNTVELAWYQNLPAQWQLVPMLRYYEQGYADFYRPYYDAANPAGYYSCDYRLSPYGALSGRLGLNKDWGQWNFSFSGERYHSSAAYAARRVDAAAANPGLVDFSVLSLSLGWRF